MANSKTPYIYYSESLEQDVKLTWETFKHAYSQRSTVQPSMRSKFSDFLPLVTELNELDQEQAYELWTELTLLSLGKLHSLKQKIENASPEVYRSANLKKQKIQPAKGVNLAENLSEEFEPSLSVGFLAKIKAKIPTNGEFEFNR